jgi:hypothetical protein
MKPFMCVIIYFSVFGIWGFTSPEGDAYDKAKSTVNNDYQTHVLSIYGKGSPDKITTWYFTFYDPTSPSKGKLVVIQNDRIDRAHPSEARITYDDALSFDPTKNKIDSAKAIATAKDYAEKNQIPYDSVNILLRRSDSGSAPGWRVELVNQGTSRGYVYITTENGTLAKFEPPRPPERTETGFAHDVEKTFRGIGADLEEFFTGERTVEKN